MTITQAATSDLGLACGQTEPEVQSASYAKGKADTQCADSAIRIVGVSDCLTAYGYGW